MTPEYGYIKPKGRNKEAVTSSMEYAGIAQKNRVWTKHSDRTFYYFSALQSVDPSFWTK